MSGRYQDKVVMISGAASGFGQMAARRFAAEGAKLALSDVNPAPLEEFEDALIACVDVSDEAQVSAHVAETVERFGRIDVALNNAGIGGSMGPVTGIEVVEFDQIMAVNARGVFLGMKYQIPVMLKAGQGVILNTASAAGLVGAAQLSAYAASKHAVVGLTRAVADEVARKGIRVNALCPSFAATPMFNEMADHMGAAHGIAREDAYARIASRVPMRRVARPEEVVQAMLWICDAENSFMTGQAISIDGGLTAV